MESIGLGGSRRTLRFGDREDNPHEHGRAFEPRAGEPIIGNAGFLHVRPLERDCVLRKKIRGLTNTSPSP